MPFIIVADHTPRLLERETVIEPICRKRRNKPSYFRSQHERGSGNETAAGANHICAEFCRLAESCAARAANDLAPENTIWEELGSEQPALAMFDEHEHEATRRTPAFAFQNHLSTSAMQVACHRDPKRWALLYRLLWRLTHGEPRLLEIVVDPDVNDFMRMEKAVRHDVHKMRAFVRFRAIEHDGATWHVAWFEPEHHIVELNAPFFRDRFREHALVDLNAGTLRSLGWPKPHLHHGCAEIRSAERGRDGRTLAHLLWQYFQSRARENEGDAEGDAEALLEEFAGGGNYSGATRGSSRSRGKNAAGKRRASRSRR